MMGRTSLISVLCSAWWASALRGGAPPSRFALSRGGSATRKRVLPVVVGDFGQLGVAVPVPGLKRRLRYSFEGAAQVALVRDVKRYGAFVHAVGEGVGVVCDVALADVSDDGASAILVATCEGLDGRVGIGRTAKEFPYRAAECAALRDDETLLGDEADALAAYDVVDDGAGHGSFDVASTWVSSKERPRETHGTPCVRPER